MINLKKWWYKEDDVVFHTIKKWFLGALASIIVLVGIVWGILCLY